MLIRTINIPVFYEIGFKILNTLVEILKEHNLYFKKVLLFVSQTGEEIVERYSLINQFESAKVLNIKQNPSIEGNIKSAIIAGNFDSILAIGGGRILDIGKYLSYKTLVPVVNIPTILSSDGISSPISIIRINNEYKSIGTVMPIGIIIDLEVIKNSPDIYTKAGLGDLMSNISAAYDWKLANEEKNERIDNFGKNLSLLPALNVVDREDEYERIGAKKLIFLKNLAEGLIMSGISMSVVGSSRPASGSEHNISHALDKLLKRNRKSHGLQVGIATLLTMYLQKQNRLLQNLVKLYKKFEFPLNFEEIGINREILIKGLKIAPSLRQRFTILDMYDHETILSAAEKVYNRVTLEKALKLDKI